MSDVGALLRYLKKKDKGAGMVIEGNTYTSEQIQLAQQLLMDAQKELDQSRRKPKLSRRRAFIVILEENYYNVKEYPKDLTLDSIHKQASQRFEFVYRDLKNNQTPQEIHPKDPCTFFESDGYRKARYRAALSHLVEYSEKYFQIEEAADSLKTVYNEVVLC